MGSVKIIILFLKFSFSGKKRGKKIGSNYNDRDQIGYLWKVKLEF